MKKTDEERKLFWDTLNGLHENSQECWDKLRAVYKPPEALCRFRSVNQNTLQQLQENKLFSHQQIDMMTHLIPIFILIMPKLEVELTL